MDQQQNAQMTRLYHVWKGNNRFFCGGRLVFGPDVASLLLSTVLIVVPAISFCGKIYSIIRNRISDGRNVSSWYTVLVIGLLLTILDVVFLFLTSTRDPGIIPRNSSAPESAEMCDLNTPSMEWISGRTPHLKIPRTKEVIVNGHAVKIKYCDTCLLYRPPRASHCSICNNCVQRFDHHCPWVGQCIGIRNYRFFYMFISTSTALCIYVLGFSLVNILQHEGTVLKALSKDFLSDFLIVYCFIAVWFVGGLTVFHFYLISTNQTTYENFRYRYDAKENPYNNGFLKNFREVFFSKIPPSMNDFQSLVVPEDENMQQLQPQPPTLDAVEDVSTSKGKIDIEMGTKCAEDDGRRLSIPEILRNLSYDEMEDDMKKDEKLNTAAAADPVLFPVEQESRDLVKINEIAADSRPPFSPDHEESSSVSLNGTGTGTGTTVIKSEKTSGNSHCLVSTSSQIITSSSSTIN